MGGHQIFVAEMGGYSFIDANFCKFWTPLPGPNERFLFFCYLISAKSLKTTFPKEFPMKFGP